MNLTTEYILKNLALDNKKEYPVEKSKDNKNVIRICKDEKQIYIGSKYSVNRDIDKLLEELKDINNETIIIIFGLGTGEHILKILENTKYNKIVIFEPDLSIIKTFINTKYSKDILESERFVLVNYTAEKCREVLDNIVTETEANNVRILSYANYNQIFNEEFEEFFKVCIDIIQKCIVNIGTEIYFSKKMIEVYLSNIKNLISGKPINCYKNVAKNVPAVVVSAGPSLSKNIHKLKAAQDEFIIICGARTLKPLLDIGVTPDYVCIIDPDDISFDFIKECENHSATMIYCEVSNFKTVDSYKGHKAIFKESSVFGNLTYKLTENNIDGLWHGGCVAHICMSFARYLGCNTIIFIGQDLAYTNNKQHDDKADFDGSNNKKIEEENNNIYVEDIHGGKVLTSRVLNFYRKNFEEYISRVSDIEFVNATEGGANIKGTKIMTLEESVNNYGKGVKKDVPTLGDFKGFNKEIIIDNLENIYSDLKNIDKSCEKYLNNIKDILKKNAKFNTKIIKLLNRIKVNNKKIQEIEILNSLINPTLNSIVSNPEYRENEKDTDEEKIKKIMEQTKIIYNEVVEGIKYLNPMLDKLIDELKEGEKNE
ncbi:motility associated factor glycosyltransferase family protein [Clostridium peptidivorans]|uniref:motility associated factor glycosyltransferase family protein n=1 Tax=Clostridium peptidivorans TaxID=100174 RepID=UPI000BE2A1F0|nr:6-hydroxymethylpterin diphosphokinase MptE-like protein [Clostridium peptidivorans]